MAMPIRPHFTRIKIRFTTNPPLNWNNAPVSSRAAGNWVDFLAAAGDEPCPATSSSGRDARFRGEDRGSLADRTKTQKKGARAKRWASRGRMQNGEGEPFLWAIHGVV